MVGWQFLKLLTRDQYPHGVLEVKMGKHRPDEYGKNRPRCNHEWKTPGAHKHYCKNPVAIIGSNCNGPHHCGCGETLE